MVGLDRFPKYPQYKDSGVEWLGKIPEGWEVKKLKFLAKINNGYDYKNIETNEGYPVLGSGGQFAFASSYLHDGEAVLLGRKGTIDKPLYVNCKFWTVDTMFYSVCNNNFSTKYIYYCSLNIPFNYYATSTALPSMTKDNLLNHKFFVPPFEEQIAIANFLDEKTKKIDDAISIKEKQIELLKERKQIIIQNAVTKGLNPNVKIKDSGVEWIGGIPEHWVLCKMKFIFDLIQTGTTPSTSNQKYFNGDIDWFNPKDLNSGYLKSAEKTISELAIKHREVKLFPAESVLIVGIGATTGKTAYLKDKATFNQQITGFYSDSSNAEYMYYLINSMSKVMLKVANYTTLPILNNEFFKEFLLPVPPVVEQKELVDFLKNQSTNIDSAINILSMQIKNLKEYKTILINNVVTGKVRVV